MEALSVGLLVGILAGQLATFKWLIKHVEGVRKEVFTMHTNSLAHLEIDIKGIEREVKEIREIVFQHHLCPIKEK